MSSTCHLDLIIGGIQIDRTGMPVLSVDSLMLAVDAGMEKRIMFGTDQMLWPGAIDLAVKTVRNTPFLSERQKRDIQYNNAARFLELSEDQEHHAGK